MLRIGSLLSALTLAAIAVVGFLPADACAQLSRPGLLTLIHGLPGDELDNVSLGINFPNDLPVDIGVGLPGALNVYFANAKLGSVNGPISLTPGVYQVEFRSANLTTPGTGTLIASATVAIRAGENHTTILYETTSRAPKASDYRNDSTLVPLLGSRVTFRHNSQVASVDMSVQSSIGQPGAAATNLSNGQQSGVFNVTIGPYVLNERPAGQTTTLLPPTKVFLFPRNDYIYYLIGSVDRGTLAVIAQNYKTTLLP